MSKPRPDTPVDPGAAPVSGPLAFGIDYSKGNKRIFVAMWRESDGFMAEVVHVRKEEPPGTESAK